jgi:hypothetical protein
MRRLAYPIKRAGQTFLEGNYLLTRFSTDTSVPRELEAHLGLSEDVLRSLIVKSAPPKPAPPVLDQAVAVVADEPAVEEVVVAEAEEPPAAEAETIVADEPAVEEAVVAEAEEPPAAEAETIVADEPAVEEVVVAETEEPPAAEAETHSSG